MVYEIDQITLCLSTNATCFRQTAVLRRPTRTVPLPCSAKTVMKLLTYMITLTLYSEFWERIQRVQVKISFIIA